MSLVFKELGELVDFKGGGTPSRNVEEYWGNSIPWATVKDLNEGITLTETQEFISELGLKNSASNLIAKGTIIIPTRMALGKVVISEIDVAINQDLKAVFVKDKETLDVKYLLRFLESNKENIASMGKGATVKGITLDQLKAIKIPLQPLAEQRRIASILDQADELRQKRQQAIEKLDQLLQATFIDMFGDPVSNPKGWDKEKMDALMTIVRGGSPRPIENFLGGTYPWIKIGDATKGDDLFITKTKEAITEEGLHKTRLLPEGSVIFANCGVSLGFARILKIQGCIHDGWLAFQDINEDKIHKLFLLKALNSITQYFRDTAPDGTQPNLNTAIMKNFELIIPPMDLQLKFIAIVESIVKQKKILETSNIQFFNLFESLQNQAFSGTL
ncbi:restriction endonuclease subunit S [Acinetobacter pittii]|uniref:restriction endonuclease subunit S n=1 Tax=Acinetobacter pittii TaxID=48296 RepID=UPI000E5A897B|nr:restriction endonuclease subunit S [Acinetobacter pittii]MDH0693144.1 restriction endonuclease subunit S [Acinetobacter pittii]MDY0761570.1 restriction endonuclease subunit S [Acinetobacter pittii]RZH01787.1 restriction endonuclease subunit S [Acinetobacter pittii]WPP65404.1 restriction endonuclease subunit S [Acinetobacter pittii]